MKKFFLISVVLLQLHTQNFFEEYIFELNYDKNFQEVYFSSGEYVRFMGGDDPNIHLQLFTLSFINDNGKVNLSSNFLFFGLSKLIENNAQVVYRMLSIFPLSPRVKLFSLGTNRSTIFDLTAGWNIDFYFFRNPNRVRFSPFLNFNFNAFKNTHIYIGYGFVEISDLARIYSKKNGNKKSRYSNSFLRLGISYQFNSRSSD